jgi:glycosyltransferase involved in cell wall biosynthesis
MKNAKTIIFLSEMPLTNGIIQAQLVPIMKAAASNGYFVHLIETVGRFDSQEKEREKAEEELQKCKILVSKISVKRYTFFPSILYFSIRSFSAIRKIIKNEKDNPCIIYARNYKFAPLLLLAGSLWKIPFIYSPRGAYVAERRYYKKFKDMLYGRLVGFFERKAIKKSAATIFETEAFQKHIKEIYKIGSPNLKVIPNYYDRALAEEASSIREEMRKKLGYGGKKVVVYAGTIEVWYDFEKMFGLVSDLKKKDPSVFFQLFTKEDYARDESKGLAETLRDLAEKYDLEEKKDYSVSSYSPQERYEYLSACDAGICLTTSQEFKTMMLYLKIVDYLGAGLPIIVNSEVKSAVEIIKSSGIGAVVDYGNWDDSISKIDIASLFAKTGNNNAEYKKFSSSDIVPQYLDLFDSVFGRIEKG